MDAKVTLISHTPEPDVMLIFTKSTRLNLHPGLLDEIRGWGKEQRAAEIAYMAKTIRSSWEFVDLTFLVEGISRSAAQQMTRTRTASYAMQSQRVADVSGMAVHVPAGLNDDERKDYLASCKRSVAEYRELMKKGMAPQDARGVLPIDITCNIVAKYNLRNFVDLATARDSLRAQGEYYEIVQDMRRLTLEAMPWAAPFFVSKYDMALEIIESVARREGIVAGKGTGWELAKAIDLLRWS